MRNKTFALILVFASLFLCLDADAYDDGDFQIWNTENVSWKINDTWKASLEEEFRWADNASDFYYQHTDLGFVYSGFADWLDVGLYYRSVFSESKDDWSHENRPHADATLKMTWHDFKISNRGRMEFRIIHGQEDKVRYRHKMTINMPFQWTKFNIQPYVADEAFIDSSSVEFNRNRVYIGFGASLTKSLKLDMYYVLESSKKTDEWNEVNALGFKLKLSF